MTVSQVKLPQLMSMVCMTTFVNNPQMPTFIKYHVIYIYIYIYIYISYIIHYVYIN